MLSFRFLGNSLKVQLIFRLHISMIFSLMIMTQVKKCAHLPGLIVSFGGVRNIASQVLSVMIQMVMVC